LKLGLTFSYFLIRCKLNTQNKKIGPVQNIISNTLENAEPNIKSSLTECNENFFSKMKIAPDYKVLRVWFDKQMNSSSPDILETPDYTPINLIGFYLTQKLIYLAILTLKLKKIAQYHLLEEEFKLWANKTGGSGK
jgi:hypothetical protein